MCIPMKQYSKQINIDIIIYFSQVTCGSAGRQSARTVYVPTPRQDHLLSELIQSHAYMDMCIIGPRGCGKSVTVERLAFMLQYHIEPIVLYQV